jgi:hypothetical protein
MSDPQQHEGAALAAAKPPSEMVALFYALERGPLQLVDLPEEVRSPSGSTIATVTDAIHARYVAIVATVESAGYEGGKEWLFLTRIGGDALREARSAV